MKKIGYVRVKANVLRDPNLSMIAKSVYSLLCIYSDDDGKCHPPTTLLSEYLNVSGRTVVRAVEELIDKNYVVKNERTFILN